MTDYKELVKKAFEAQKSSYSPYSHFKVGAALLSEEGKVYLGCNIENATFTPTNCAERTAFFKAVSEGVKDFTAIAIVGNTDSVEAGSGDYCAPCGVCRQVMAEFCDPETFSIILAKSENDYVVLSLKELLPLGFTNKNLSK
ncbi:MAG: cytidine deaminase [Clostridiales bacterium]|jgi:cytidine deaminase|nr:cytidine deaminase [Clostridiales bacterium]